MSSLGEEFRGAREARGLSLSDVAEHIHIRSTYLQAIEEEEWTAIGPPVYIRGFLRTYARFLGIDPESVVERFNAVVPSAPPTMQYGSAVNGASDRRGGPSFWVWIGAAIALALVAYVAYGYYQLKQPAPGPSPVAAASAAATPTTASATAESSPTATPAPAPTPARQTVSLRFNQLSWLRASVDGNVVLEGNFPAGTVRDFHGKRVTLLVGNAGGVEVTAPGRGPKVLGAPGEVVERSYTLGKLGT